LRTVTLVTPALAEMPGAMVEDWCPAALLLNWD
jgi:hypothetical protein